MLTMFAPGVLQDMPVAFRDANTWKWFMGLGEEDKELYHDVLDYAKAPADEAWVFSCARVRWTAAMSVPLRVYVKDGTTKLPAEETDDEDALELLDLLTVVNPSGEWNGSRFKAYIAAGSAIWGGSYFAKVRGRFGGRPRELWWIDLAHVEVKSDSGRQADLYVYDPPKGGRSEYKPQDVIAFRNVNLEDPLKPLSPLSSARYDAATNRYGAQWTASTLKNDGIPKGAFVPQKGAIIEPQQKRSLIQVLRGLRGPKNAGKTPFLNAEIDWKPLSLLPKDAEWLAARKVSRMTVAAAMGVPLPLAGDWEGLSQYNVLRDAVRFMWHQTLIPELDWTADVLNDQLVPEFDPTRRRLCVEFDYHAVEALGPTWNDEWTGWLSGIEHQVITPNRFIEHFNLGPQVEWGDRPVPRTTIAVKAPDNTPMELPFASGEAPPSPVSSAPPNQPETDAAETLRSFRGLYTHPSVKAFISNGSHPLDTRFLGRVTDAQRATIEDGLRRRHSGAQIADSLRVAATRQSDDATSAVLGQLRAQWPDRELDLVKRGSWTFDPAMKLKKIDYARRPVPRNPQKVDDFTSAIEAGAAPRPAVIVKDPETDEWTPIDGWHHLLAADHAGLKKVPVYKGDGDDDWIRSLLAFNDTIPTPSMAGGDQK